MGSISSRKEVLGTGLRNAVGEYNCFLNVIIQVLKELGIVVANCSFLKICFMTMIFCVFFIGLVIMAFKAFQR